jgi:aldehyde oxidoreductase
MEYGQTPAAQRSIRIRFADDDAAIKRIVTVDPMQSLAVTLRESVGLTGTKIGCDAGDCGACTIRMNGELVCACLVTSAQADGAILDVIETGDDLSDGARAFKRDVFAAFERKGAAQCGICSPGMVQAAVDLLVRNPTPTKRDVADAIGGVLCRCTGYIKIVEAVMDAAADAALRDVSPSPSLAVGRRLPRVDGSTKVRGLETFGADAGWSKDTLYLSEPCLWLRVVRSPHASATFTLGDLDAFQRVFGLAAVITAKDVPGANSFGIFPNTKDQPVFAEGFVRFRGEAVIGLVGEKDQVDAIDVAHVPITWQPRQGVHGVEHAVRSDAPSIHAHIADNVLTRGNLKRGDVAKGHAEAHVTVVGRFETTFVEHAYIEPEAGYAAPDPRDPRRMVVVASTQAPYMDREAVARVLGVAEHDVIVQPTACGGGFGGKLDVAVQPLLAVAARKVNGPVRMVFSRIESMVSTTKRHPSKIWVKASAHRDGRLSAFEMTADFNTGAYASWGPTVANRVPVHATGPYKVPHVWNQTRAIYTNDTPAGAFRGFGVPQAALAQEAALDDIAERLNLDRWHIRRINAIDHGDATATGQILQASAGLPQCLDALKPAWDQALVAAATHNATDARHKRGVGIACMWYGCGNTSISNPSEMRIVLSDADGFQLISGAVDIGQGSHTVLHQIAADALGLDVASFKSAGGVIANPSTAASLDAGKTSASRQTFVSGNAVRLAAEDLRAKVLRLTNASPDARFSTQVRADGGHDLVIVDGDGRRELALAKLQLLAGDTHVLEGPVLQGYGRYDPPTTPLDADGQGVPYATYGFATQIAEVIVDTALGTTKVLHIHAAHDVGRAINPMLVEGQIHGGIAQGLGLALIEEFIPGKTENLHDYLIPTVGDMPPVTIHIIEDPEPEGPFGAKGVGEPALVATAPAILGAIRHATGITMRRVPVLPHRLWDALQHRDAP